MRFARILCCAALAVCAFGVRAQQVMLDKVVAVVGGSSITYSEVENTARRLTESRREQGYTSDRDPMNEALEQLMMQKLLYNQALIDSVEIMKTDIMARVEEEVQDMIAREGTIPAVEAKMHNPIFNIRENLRRRYEEEAYASGMQREVIGKVTIIPGEVELGIDMRGIDVASLDRMEARLKTACTRICEKRRLKYFREKTSDIPPIEMSSETQQKLLDAAKRLRIPHRLMISGAGHDAMSFAHICDTGMVFIPCVKGISHNKKEFATIESILDGAMVMYEHLKEEAL